jgi:hypothetical protein
MKYQDTKYYDSDKTKMRIIAAHNYELQKTALISRHNAYIRLYIDGKEVFYYNLNNVFRDLLEQGYTLDINF